MAIVPFKAVGKALSRVSKRTQKKLASKRPTTTPNAYDNEVSFADTRRRVKGKKKGKLLMKEEDLLFGKGQKTRRGRKVRRERGY
tara:strand:+ start:764 stop:1018 length:255 start_codon:yes stop_codon:yes gene_type:complete